MNGLLVRPIGNRFNPLRSFPVPWVEGRPAQEILNKSQPMRSIASRVVAAILIAPVLALADPPLGVFGHQFTEREGEPVWTIEQESADVFTLFVHGDSLGWRLDRLDSDEIKSFWRKMGWPQGAVHHASCIGDGESVFCHMPANARRRIPWLAENKSDYFYYDTMAGVMEIRLIAR
ncbi:hypothetical protein N8I74_14700 [Chitiniphilus purpureus]|uniref:Uncharacterized protein n=1 Tax=Chitiniphilus purpureus TaxID=2981137 RepID=A0ABY6DJN6_9NEIS|nr:hypothetical protein [Chitiniphilus sp. CD1]UXY14559.1 hypothetical protein N8I74_14700 [Chitiniphilus sp. CD1]